MQLVRQDDVAAAAAAVVVAHTNVISLLMQFHMLCDNVYAPICVCMLCVHRSDNIDVLAVPK